jgi:hypothetical protein
MVANYFYFLYYLFNLYEDSIFCNEIEWFELQHHFVYH